MLSGHLTPESLLQRMGVYCSILYAAYVILLAGDNVTGRRSDDTSQRRGDVRGRSSVQPCSRSLTYYLINYDLSL